MTSHRAVLALAIAAVCASESIAAVGDVTPRGWRGPQFFVSTRGTKVSSLLKDLGANYGVPVIVSREIDDTFVGTLRGATPDKALDELSQLFKLAWYFDGQVIYVYKAHEVTTEVLTPEFLDSRELVNYLQGTGALDKGYCSIRTVDNFNAVEVFGVPVCVERISKLAKNLDEKTMQQVKTQEVVEVFPLRYASAIDGSYSFRGQQVVVPGVVTELRDMARNRSLAAKAENGQSVPADGNVASFSADTRQNAVIVRDRKANMPLYAQLIKQLDLRPMQIEISVAIIDVDAGDLSQLGLDFGGSVGLGTTRIGFNSGGNSGDGTFSAVLSNTADFFIKVNALEQHSKAKVLSRPSVVTLNNMQAVLDRNVTFYTKLQGEKAVELASVASGSLLRVTPRIIEGDADNEVLLTLDIQDGRQEGGLNNVENLPQVVNSGIATQALLKSGQSLLLGGFVQDKERQGARKIPILGDIPILGKLFTNESRESSSVVRLFLIKAEPHS